MYKNDIQPRSREQFIVSLSTFERGRLYNSWVAIYDRRREYSYVYARRHSRFTVQSLAATVTHGLLYFQAARYSCLSFRHLNAVCTYN